MTGSGSKPRSIGEGPGSSQGGLLPVVSLLFAATLWGTLWYPLRRLEEAGLPGLWATLAIYLAPLLLSPWLLRGAARVSWRTESRWLLLLLFASGWCNVSFILAVIDGQVVRVLLLFYLSPVWAVLLGHWLIGEHLTRETLGVMAIALSGAGIMLWEPEIGLPWPREGADWLALSSGVAFALLNVSVRRLQEVPLGVKTTLSWCGVVLVAGVGLLAATKRPPEADGVVWLAAAVLGLLVMSVMTWTVQYGVTHLPVRKSSVILLFEIVAGAVSAFLLAGEALTLRDWLGGGLIVLAAYLSARTEGDQASR